jgi:ATP-dependent helicase HrpB
MWPEEEMAHLLPFAPPEIRQADLAPLALDLAAAGIKDPASLRWLDIPAPAAYSAAVELLRQLGAVDDKGRITPHGRRMTSMAAHPRLAHMILRGAELRLGALAADLAALLGERDPLRAGDHHAADVDIRRRLDVVRTNDRGREASRALIAALRTQASHWREIAGASPNDYSRDEAGRVLALAYPDRIAQRRPGGEARYLLRVGAGATLPEGDPFSREGYLVVAESDGKRPSSTIRLAAPVTLDDIESDFAEQIETVDHVEWDDAADEIRARRVRRLGAIVLEERNLEHPDATAVAEAVANAVERRGLSLLPMSEDAARLRERLRALHHHDASWPDVSDDALAASLLPQLSHRLEHVRSAADLGRIDMRDALRSLLTPAQRASFDQLAPTHFVAPTGSRIPIDYSDPESPSVPVRLQELFGLAVTPSIMRGQVPLTLHLLSPAHRPVQVTRDLAGFWRNSYFDVRKDLRGRYPKHHWPDDPLATPPTKRAKKRG